MSVFPFPLRPQNSFHNNPALPPAPPFSSNRVLEAYHYMTPVENGEALVLLTPPPRPGVKYYATDYAVLIDAGRVLVENQGSSISGKLGSYAYATINMENNGLVFIYAAWLIVEPFGGSFHA